jgi:hypothetical protein
VNRGGFTHGWRRWALIAALAVVALLVLAPAAVATGAGRLLGELWVSVMGAVVSLFGG